jgi:hypothetical protein
MYNAINDYNVPRNRSLHTTKVDFISSDERASWSRVLQLKMGVGRGGERSEDEG